MLLLCIMYWVDLGYPNKIVGFRKNILMQGTHTGVIVYLVLISLLVLTALIVAAIGSTHVPKDGNNGAPGAQGKPGRAQLQYTRLSNDVVQPLLANGNLYAYNMVMNNVISPGNTDDVTQVKGVFTCVNPGVFQISGAVVLTVTPDPTNLLESVTIFTTLMVNGTANGTYAQKAYSLELNTLHETITPVVVVPLKQGDTFILQVTASANLVADLPVPAASELLAKNVEVVRISD